MLDGSTVPVPVPALLILIPRRGASNSLSRTLPTHTLWTPFSLFLRQPFRFPFFFPSAGSSRPCSSSLPPFFPSFLHPPFPPPSLSPRGVIPVSVSSLLQWSRVAGFASRVGGGGCRRMRREGGGRERRRLWLEGGAGARVEKEEEGNKK